MKKFITLLTLLSIVSITNTLSAQSFPACTYEMTALKEAHSIVPEVEENETSWVFNITLDNSEKYLAIDTEYENMSFSSFVESHKEETINNNKFVYELLKCKEIGNNNYTYFYTVRKEEDTCPTFVYLLCNEYTRNFLLLHKKPSKALYELVHNEYTDFIVYYNNER